MARKSLSICSNLKLPLDWATLATVVYGARGSGKTSLGRVFAEEAHAAGLRFCAIDLKGDWWGLKSSADGKDEGLPVVVFGGDHQDVPLEHGAGKFVGETVAKLEQSCILDLEYFSKGKQVRFLSEFFLSLYDANREPLVLLLDEAQRYAPQARMVDPDSAKCLGAVEDLVKLGRKHGVAPVLFTQRGSGLNKEVSELCDMLVAFRTPGPLDQDRVKDWLDANTTKGQRDQVMGQLSGLATGTAVFASGHPDLKVFGVHAVRRPDTFDSSATPKVGQHRLEPKKLAKPDLDQLKVRMAEAIERAAADDPKALRAKLAKAEAELLKLRAKPALAPTPAKPLPPERVEVPLFDEAAFGKLFEEATTEVEGVAKRAAEGRAALGRLMVTYKMTMREAVKAAGKRPLVATATPIRESKASPHIPRRPSDSEGDPSLGKCERALLTALSQFGALRMDQAAIATGYSPGASTVPVAASKLKQLGHVEAAEERGFWAITESGRDAIGHVRPLPAGPALAEHWFGMLGKCEREILRSVIDAHPGTTSMNEAAAANGYSTTASTVPVAVSKLKKLGLISGRGAALQACERLV
jgi:hypothetical protein